MFKTCTLKATNHCWEELKKSKRNGEKCRIHELEDFLSSTLPSWSMYLVQLEG